MQNTTEDSLLVSNVAMETQANSIPLQATGVLQEIHLPTEWKHSISIKEPPHINRSLELVKLTVRTTQVKYSFLGMFLSFILLFLSLREPAPRLISKQSVFKVIQK